MKNNILVDRGFTDIIPIKFDSELKNLQQKIYDITKKSLVDHDQKLSIEEKIQLKFKIKPTDEFWSNLMKEINNSSELKNLIKSQPIKNTFKLIFENPEEFEISTFRARFPQQKRVLYNWHQDEGTWYLSKKKQHQGKFPATLWLSLNGASKKESIQLLKYSHKKKLLDHQYVAGQGFFNIKNKEMINEKEIFTVETKPSECIIFHPLTIHRSVPADETNLRPRYTIDIRYYDQNFKANLKVEWKFLIRKIIGKVI